MINQTVETAFRVLLFLGAQDSKRLVSLQEIHGVVGGSSTYLAKVTAVLSHAGLLKSQRGAQGGLSLGKDPKKITMLEVVEAAQGAYSPFSPTQCSTGSGKWCGYHKVAADLNLMLASAMKKVSLEQMSLHGSKIQAGCVLDCISAKPLKARAKSKTKHK